jgi:hypothetical protein
VLRLTNKRCDEAFLATTRGGADCGNAKDRVVGLIDEKQAQITARIAELTTFAAQLNGVRDELEASTPPSACRDDLSCCVPAAPTGVTLLPLLDG